MSISAAQREGYHHRGGHHHQPPYVPETGPIGHILPALALSPTWPNLFLRVFRGCSWTHLIPAAHVDQRRPPRRLPPPRWSPPPTTLCPRNWPNRPHSPCSSPHSHLAELAFACCSRLFLDAPMQGVARGPDGIWRPRVRSPPCLTLSASHRRADPRFLDPQRNKILNRHVHRPVHWTQPLH